ncbi:MAG TPA: hypothetical protein VFA65_07940 [Bryobacteraceae bacterium]|nr:hypothetical protein [Bryobacteraceae bacterium]
MRTGVSDAVALPQLPITGTDGNGTIYGLIYPIVKDQPALMIAISGLGLTLSVKQYELPSGMVPRRILSYESEIGIVRRGGDCVWFAT